VAQSLEGSHRRRHLDSRDDGLLQAAHELVEIVALCGIRESALDTGRRRLDVKYSANACVAPTRSDVRSASERSALPKTCHLACAEVGDSFVDDKGKYPRRGKNNVPLGHWARGPSAFAIVRGSSQKRPIGPFSGVRFTGASCLRSAPLLLPQPGRPTTPGARR
jgi:hypothetical protein